MDLAKRREARKKELEEKRAKLAAVKEQQSRLVTKSVVVPDEPASPPPSQVDVSALLEKVSHHVSPIVQESPRATPVDNNVSLVFRLSTPVSGGCRKKIVETYSKSTQTTVSGVKEDADEVSEQVAKALVERQKVVLAKEEPVVASESPPKEIAWMVDDNAAMTAPEFSAFCELVGPAMERAIKLAHRFDFMGDFVRDAGDAAGAGQDGTLVVRHALFDERWCAARAVSALDWSLAHTSLVAVALTAPERVGGHSEDPDGVVCVWSANNLLDRPEIVFHCASRVTAVAFANFSPTIVIGGTYSGQIVLWDTRAGSAPVQRALVSSTGHTHPVFSVAVVGTAAAHSLVTVSTDGRMCVWALDSLVEPLETLELVATADAAVSSAPATPVKPGLTGPTTPRTPSTPTTVAAGTPTRGPGVSMPVAATVVRFQRGETNTFLCGAESGVVWAGARHGAQSGVHTGFAGHAGPITGLSWHPSDKTTGGGLPVFLTCSTDWTVRLWHAKHATHGALRVFDDAQDYVVDVAWSPLHPSLFAAADGAGNVCLWDLAKSLEEPQVRMSVSAPHALHKLAWHADGKLLAVGDANGVARLLDVPDTIAVPPTNASALFDAVIQRLLLDRTA